MIQPKPNDKLDAGNGARSELTPWSFVRAAGRANLLVATLVVAEFSGIALVKHDPKAFQMGLWLVPFVTLVIWVTAAVLCLLSPTPRGLRRSSGGWWGDTNPLCQPGQGYGTIGWTVPSRTSAELASSESPPSFRGRLTMRRGNLVVETGINEGRSEHRSCSVWRATMSEHHATIDWKRETPDFAYETYNRDHDWQFDAGVTVRASATPAYLGSESCVDPEEAFVASLSSCHMLTFLAIACKKRFTVDGYRDQAVGILGKDQTGRMAMTRVTLRPQVRFGGEKTPTPEELAQMHGQAHHACFIANSVKTEVVIEPL